MPWSSRTRGLNRVSSLRLPPDSSPKSAAERKASRNPAPTLPRVTRICSQVEPAPSRL